MSQPAWKYVGNLGDRSPLDHGGLFVFVDETGVYPPEMEQLERITPDDEEEDRDRYEVRRVVLDPCTYVDGVLSDNKYHPCKPAWFASDIGQIASFVGQSVEDMITGLCSDDPLARANAYRAILDYHGWENGDSYPLELSRTEARKRYRQRGCLNKFDHA